jgi:methylated-DNA-protein-cysteine methyltransferase-like protein
LRERASTTTLFEAIYAVVRRIPPGRVTTYGEVARLAGLHNGARTVGWAMASLPDDRTAPWWRVIRSDGSIAPRPGALEQRRRLRREGVTVSTGGTINLRRDGWPKGR